jgi:hypothetical protein
VRISSTAVKEDLSIAQSIIDLGCDITTVIENLEATESSETQMLDPEIRKRSKRPHNNDDASNGLRSKKIKILDDDNLIKLSSHKGQEFIFNEALIRRLMPSFELDPAPTLNQNEYSAAGNDENPEQSLNVMNDDYTADIYSEQTRQQAIGVFQDLRRSLSSSKVATTTNSDESTFSENEREDDIIASHQQALLITEPNNESQPSYSPITNTTNTSTLPSNNLSQK